MNQALGILEVTGFTPAMVALDAMEKAADVQVLQAELNDFYGVCLKIVGTTANVTAAVAAGKTLAEQMGGKPISNVIHRPDDRALASIQSKPEISPLIQQNVVLIPQANQNKESTVAESSALGFIETQGFTAVFEAIDSACKAANVEVVGKEKLGGGYITIVVRGDVAAVKAAIDAGKSRVDGLGKLIAAHVIARPSSAVLSLLPKA
jgi:carbon dioxide concentrating mechanism protein CcmO